jgi:hypothetical protein
MFNHYLKFFVVLYELGYIFITYFYYLFLLLIFMVLLNIIKIIISIFIMACLMGIYGYVTVYADYSLCRLQFMQNLFKLYHLYLY